jgi:uncharacterized RDD family membrane protein YckC
VRNVSAVSVQILFGHRRLFPQGPVHVLPLGRRSTTAPDHYPYMKPRFEPDSQKRIHGDHSPTLIDPDAYDTSEQTFAASLEQTASQRPPRFVVEAEASDVSTEIVPKSQLLEEEACAADEQEESKQDERMMPFSAADIQVEPDPESWRREVAARLSHYRARRRPREPRYPSLQLKFETEPVWNDPVADSPALHVPAIHAPVNIDEPPRPIPIAHDGAASVQPAAIPRIRLAEPADYPRAIFAATNEATAKVIEFASYSAPPRPFDELAEPVLQRPRIVEAPELVPLPPALGGISIEPVEEPANERRPGFEIPLRAAPMGRRIAAAGIDAVLVMSAISAFAYIFFRMTAEVPSPAKVAGTAFFLAGAFWCAYQYLLLVYSGATLGLKLAKLELQRFDGDPAPRRIRRWRVLASVLSGVSLGLGYAWCFLDEDQLCWHDRITRTYMAPRKTT